MPSRGIAGVLAVLIFVLDRWSKVWIERNVTLYDTWPVIAGFFNIVHTKNKGAAFGIFADSESALRSYLLVGVSLVVLAGIVYALLKPGSSGLNATRATVLGLGLIMGGAAGNIYDRIAYGEVTDFLEFYQGDYRFAAFNVADAAITTGAGLLLLDMWLSREKKNVSKAY